MEIKKTLLSFATPIAIVIAGIIIAGAIVLKDGGFGVAKAPKEGAAAMLKKNTIAEEVGLNKKKFAECLASGKYAQKVESDAQSGAKAGVQGTPHTFIINTEKPGMAYSVGGAQPLENVKQAIEYAIAGNSVGSAKSEVPAVRPDEHIFGNPNAQVFAIEYSDLECPFCKNFHKTMMQAMNIYAAGGRVAWVYRHYPLDQIHPKARKEAEATECAAELGGNAAFWSYTNKLFEITPSNNKLDAALL